MKKCSRCQVKIDRQTPAGWHRADICVFCEYVLENLLPGNALKRVQDTAQAKLEDQVPRRAI